MLTYNPVLSFFSIYNSCEEEKNLNIPELPPPLQMDKKWLVGEIDNRNMAKSKAASVKLNQTSFDPLIKIFSDHEESFKLTGN